MKYLARLILFSALGFGLVTGMAGCGGPEILISPLVNGVITWINGEGHKYYANDHHTIYRATKRSLLKLGIPVSKDEPSDDRYYIKAGNNDRFKINIVPHEENISRLSIRVNFMGDKDYAELIFQEVDKQLGIIEFDRNGNPTRRKN